MAVNRAVSSHLGRVSLTRAGVPDSAIIVLGPNGLAVYTFTSPLALRKPQRLRRLSRLLENMGSFLLSRPLPHGGPPTLISAGFQDEQGVVVAYPKHLLTPPPGTRRWTALVGHQQQGQVARRKPAPARQLVLRHAQILKQFPHCVPVRPHPWGARDSCASPRLLPPPARAAGRVGCPPRAPPAGARTGRPSLTRSGGNSLCMSTCSALYRTGPETVNSRELDSFLPSRVQMAPGRRSA